MGGGSPRKRVEDLEKKKFTCTSLDSTPGSPGPWPSRCSDYAILDPFCNSMAEEIRYLRSYRDYRLNDRESRILQVFAPVPGNGALVGKY